MNVYLYQSWTQKELKNAYIWYWWSPWSNTIAYYPLESDGNDNANNYNLSNLWTTTFGTIWGIKWAIFSANTTSWLYNNSVSIPQWNNSWTVNMYIYPTSYNSSEDDVFFMWTGNYNQWFLIYDLNPISISTWWSAINSTTNVSLNTWSNIVITQSSKTYTIYVNWVSVKSWTMSSANLTGTNLNLGYAYWNDASNKRFVWWMSEFILENKTWTATEISNYYNRTKSKYWIS